MLLTWCTPLPARLIIPAKQSIGAANRAAIVARQDLGTATRADWLAWERALDATR